MFCAKHGWGGGAPFEVAKIHRTRLDRKEQVNITNNKIFIVYLQTCVMTPLSLALASASSSPRLLAKIITHVDSS